MKNDMFHSFMKWVDYNRFKVLGVLMAMFLVGFVASCESKTVSLNDGVTKVTGQQLALEVIDAEAGLAEQLAAIEVAQATYNRNVEVHNQKVESGLLDLQKQDQFRAKVLDVGGGMISAWVTGGQIDTGVLVSSVLALGGFGALVGSVADGKRKDAKIKEDKELLNSN